MKTPSILFKWRYRTEHRKIWIARLILKKKLYKVPPDLPDIKIHYKAIEINALVWQWSTDIKSEGFNGSTWINSSTCGNSVYNKDGI